MHLWRYVGWLMGVEDQWLARSEAEGRRRFYHAMLLSPGPDQNSRRLASALASRTATRSSDAGGACGSGWSTTSTSGLVALFHGRSGMAELGLPPSTPWYLALAVPRNIVKHGLARVVPGGRGRLRERADRQVTARVAEYRA